MPNAESSDDGVDRANLHASAAAQVMKLGGANVVVPIWGEEGDVTESLNDFICGFCAGKTLQEFLQYKTRRCYRLPAFKSEFQSVHFWDIRHSIAPKRQRPHRRINKQCHERERSAL